MTLGGWEVLPDVEVLLVGEVFSGGPEGALSGVKVLLVEDITYPESRYGLFSAGCGGPSEAPGGLF